MSTKTKKLEIIFKAEALVTRVEDFAVGRHPARTGNLPLRGKAAAANLPRDSRSGMMNGETKPEAQL